MCRRGTDLPGSAAPAANDLAPENVNGQIVDWKLNDGGTVTAIGRGGRHRL
jgi:hypothetical protein